MSNLRADKHNGEDFVSADQTIRKASHSSSSRSDILSKLVKLVGLSEYRGTKSSTARREVGRTEGLVVIGEPSHSPVTVDLATGSFRASKGEKTLRRSSSDSRLSVSITGDDGKGPDLSLIFGPAQAFNLDGARNKHDRKSLRRKGKNPPVNEPVTPLTPIPEMSNAFERASILTDLSCVNISNFADQDALMETDSIRARAAIAMARAQLEHSRPASYSRKLERSSNQMMMLPGELEEKERGKPSVQLAPRMKNDARETNDHAGEDDVGAIRKAVGQSQAMVLSLMAAKEAISQRATTRKHHHSPLAASASTSDLPAKRPSKPFQGLYRAGDIPPSPPPSIPLPQLPPRPSHENPHTQSASIKRGTSLKNEITPTESAYKGLPTEYNTDDEMLKHIDVLMQSLADSGKISPETDRRRPYSSLPSRRGRRSHESSMSDSSRQGHQKRSERDSTSQIGLRQLDAEGSRSQSSRSRPTPSFIPPVPALPRLPAKYMPSHPGAPGPTVQPYPGVRVENISVTQMNDDAILDDQCHFVLSSYNDFGELTHTTRVSYPRNFSHESSSSNVPSGHTEKYFQQFASPSSPRHPTLPRSMKLGQYVEPSAGVSSLGRGVSTLSNKTSTSSTSAPSCPPGITAQGFLRSVSSLGLPGRARTPEPTPQRTTRLY
ncbi:hypothetical protein OPQ81_000961 [Rhizoctonia solani]|nr:hypothetical protein OPQ81_000961 [Rhizoctonia solani]